MTNNFLLIRKYAWGARRFGFTLDKFYARICSHLTAKVLCVCIPKSGTHLLERALCLYPPLYRYPIRTLHRGNIEKYGGIPHVLQDLRPKQLLFSHLEYDKTYIDAARATGVKVLFLIRDPRDICVSQVHYIMRTPAHHLHHQYIRCRDFRERLLLSILGAPDHGHYSIGDTLAHFSGWLESGALVIRYEDLIGAKGKGESTTQRDEITRIFCFLCVDLTSRQLSQISDHLHYDASPTFRKGSTGDWQENFDSEATAAFKAVANDQIIKYGYENGSDW